jgi:probable HAF family extracellular repeat protein
MHRFPSHWFVRQPSLSFTATQVASFTGLGSVSAFDATAINDNGQVGGTFSSSEGGEPSAAAFLYAGGVTNPVAFSRTSTGNGLNDKGQVVGQQDLTPPFPLQPPPQAFLYNYSNNRTIDIDKVSGRQSAANSINNAGQVTGSVSTATCPIPVPSPPTCLGNTHAFFYAGAGLAGIGTLGGTYSEGTSINNRGEIAGISTVANGATHLFLYAQGRMHDLGTATGQVFASALLNDRGDILESTAGRRRGSELSVSAQHLPQTALPRQRDQQEHGNRRHQTCRYGRQSSLPVFPWDRDRPERAGRLVPSPADQCERRKQQRQDRRQRTEWPALCPHSKMRELLHMASGCTA